MGRSIDTTRGSRAMVIALLAVFVSLATPISARNTRAAPLNELSHYDIEVSFTPESRTLDGSINLDWLNATGETQDTLYFRLYPNAAYYKEGETTVDEVEVDSRDTSATIRNDRTVLEVALGRSVNPGERTEVDFAFTTTVPTTSDASFGILGGDPESGWWLADWYPIVAGWEKGSGWYLAPPTRFGDPTFADSATYDLAIITPSGLDVLGSGVTIATTDDPQGERIVTEIATGPGRDLTLSLLPADHPGAVDNAITQVAGIDLRVSLPDDVATPGLSAAILEIVSTTLPLYERWLGEYPDAGLDITHSPLAGASGVAWSGIIWLDLEGITRNGVVSDDEMERLRFVLMHELSHQWIALTIGSNNNDHGFMTEGLANIVTVLAIRELHGAEDAGHAFRSQVAAGYRGIVASGTDGVADAPLTDQSDFGTRPHLIYGKAAIGFEAIRQVIGDEAFLAGLSAYAVEFRFAVSEPSDLRTAFETASGADLADLWSFWFEEQRTTLSDIDAVLNAFAPS